MTLRNYHVMSAWNWKIILGKQRPAKISLLWNGMGFFLLIAQSIRTPEKCLVSQKDVADYRDDRCCKQTLLMEMGQFLRYTSINFTIKCSRNTKHKNFEARTQTPLKQSTNPHLTLLTTVNFSWLFLSFLLYFQPCIFLLRLELEEVRSPYWTRDKMQKRKKGKEENTVSRLNKAWCSTRNSNLRPCSKLLRFLSETHLYKS